MLAIVFRRVPDLRQSSVFSQYMHELEVTKIPSFPLLFNSGTPYQRTLSMLTVYISLKRKSIILFMSNF